MYPKIDVPPLFGRVHEIKTVSDIELYEVVGASGLEGIVAEIIENAEEYGPIPAAFRALTLN